MPKMSELDIPLCMRWTVDTRNKPDYAHPKCSPALRCRAGEWSLYYRYCYIWGHHVLGLQKMTDVSPDPFNVSVLVEGGGTGRIAAELSQKTRCTDGYSGTSDEGGKIYQWDVWVMSNSYVERTDPELNQLGRLRFLVVIQDKDAPTDFLARHSKQATDVAVQTTPCSSPLTEVPSKTSSPACEQMSESFASQSQDCLESLAEDFAKLLEEGSDPDVELHCKGSSYMAHKAVLSVRSPVLAKMLHSDMVEGRTGVAKIEDMDQDTFGLFLRYLYTGRLEALTFDAAVRLYEVGDMYGVKSLARRCSRFLIQNLTVENSCDALAVANAHSDGDLEETVTDYVIENNVPMSEDLWLSFCEGHPKLANKVYRQFCKRLFK